MFQRHVIVKTIFAVYFLLRLPNIPMQLFTIYTILIDFILFMLNGLPHTKATTNRSMAEYKIYILAGKRQGRIESTTKKLLHTLH